MILENVCMKYLKNWQKKKAAQQLPLNVNPQTHNTRNGIMTQCYSNCFRLTNIFKRKIKLFYFFINNF